MKHFGSTGRYFSFGNKALYGRRGKDGSLTVGLYTIKHNQNTKKQQCLISDTNCIEHVIAIDLGQLIMALSKHIHNLRFLLAPVLNIACKM